LEALPSSNVVTLSPTAANYLTTDVISMVVFTSSWNLLTSSTNRGIRETMAAVVKLFGLMHQTPLFRYNDTLTALLVPRLAWAGSSLMQYAKDMMRASVQVHKNDPTISDFFGQFSEAKDPDTGEAALTRREVALNSSNFIIAGSDTTSSSIAATFYYLARHPDAYARVATEVRTKFASPDEIRQGPVLSSCVYLRAAINEAMRMCPVAPQPLWRAAEPGGCTVDGHFIPEGLIVGSGIYSLHRNPEAFPDPYKYDVERWIVHASNEQEEEEEKARIKEMSKSFAPFSIGQRQCIAKNFALMELTLTMAHVFWRMDFEKPEGVAGQVGEGANGEMMFKSYFTSFLDGPMVRFKVRAL
jgi:cytochrome P450